MGPVVTTFTAAAPLGKGVRPQLLRMAAAMDRAVGHLAYRIQPDGRWRTLASRRRLGGMTSPLTPRQRNRSRHVLNAATGLLTAATVASVGIASGLAASATKDSQDAKRAAKAQAAEAAASAAAAEPVRAQRPTKTIVTTKVVASASRSGTASLGGGTVRSSSSSTSTRASTKPAVTKPVKVVVPSTGS